MKRLNPETGKPFKYGDVREDGLYFKKYVYSQPLKKDGYYKEQWHSTDLSILRKKYYEKERASVEGHIKQRLSTIKIRAKNKNLPFDLDLDYLTSIFTDTCPVFGIKLEWTAIQGLTGSKNNYPSLDRIDSNLGYVKGNVQWISNLANVMKQNATQKQLKQFANWINKTVKE